MHADNAFVTLTYAPEHLPRDGSLDHKHFQLFMKRLRHRMPEGEPLSYFMCGEYGERTRRPHYHAALFGVHFWDRTLYKKNHRGEGLYRSDFLDGLWKLGQCTIGDVTFESATYIARYITVKVTGKEARNHYWSAPSEDGEVYPVVPEYCKSSLRPAVGKRWFDEFSGDVFPDDFVVVEGRIAPTPRAYSKWLERTDPVQLTAIKEKRKARAAEYAADSTPERRRARAKVARARLKLNHRELDE